MNKPLVDKLLEAYPRIFLACHTRHVRDPQTDETLSDHQASILDHLDRVSPAGLVELARHMGVTPATMSIAVERLVRMGYVIRERDERDGRRVCLRLAPSGERLRSARSVLDPGLVEELLSRLSPEEQAEGLRGLEILAKAASELQRCRSEQGAWSHRNRTNGSAEGEQS